MAFKLIKPLRHQEWFPIPNAGDAKILVQDTGEADSGLRAEMLFSKVRLGLDIKPDLREGYLDAIADWSGVVDENEKALPCDSENKVRFLESRGMLAFLRECMSKVSGEGAKQNAEAQKN